MDKLNAEERKIAERILYGFVGLVGVFCLAKYTSAVLTNETEIHGEKYQFVQDSDWNLNTTEYSIDKVLSWRDSEGDHYKTSQHLTKYYGPFGGMIDIEDANYDGLADTVITEKNTYGDDYMRLNRDSDYNLCEDEFATADKLLADARVRFQDTLNIPSY